MRIRRGLMFLGQLAAWPWLRKARLSQERFRDVLASLDKGDLTRALELERSSPSALNASISTQPSPAARSTAVVIEIPRRSVPPYRLC